MINGVFFGIGDGLGLNKWVIENTLMKIFQLS